MISREQVSKAQLSTDPISDAHGCPDCGSSASVNRRDFLRATGAAVVATAAMPALVPAVARAADTAKAQQPESIVKVLFESMSDKQKQAVCFDWDFVESERGLLRTRVANNWQITDPVVNTDFYTAEQQKMIRDIFEGMIQPDWHKRIYKQCEDDAGGFGEDHAIAIFGKPGDGKFEFVLTGRHMTLRCDGNSADHVAFGGPIFYGHAADGFDEGPTHPGNVFWPQALEANKVYEMLDGKQRKLSLVKKLPSENQVAFGGPDGSRPGIPVTEMSMDQKEQLQKVLAKLLEPYRQSDRDEALACIKAQGGLDKCALAFYQDGDIGNDGVWDCWRLEGPAMVWYFRGAPHVHTWVNIASDPSVKLNA
jgi:hypothetical protein